jgi:hypothetical protein
MQRAWISRGMRPLPPCRADRDADTAIEAAGGLQTEGLGSPTPLPALGLRPRCCR